MIEYQVKVYEDNTSWYLNGKRHRVGGPAMEWVDGSNMWYLNGKMHRVDGPAVEMANGSKEWCLNGVRVTEWEVITPVKQPIKWVGLTEEEVEQIVDGNTLGSGWQFWCSGKGVAEGIEAKLKEKNNG